MRFAHRADCLGHKPAPAEPRVTVANAKGWGVASSARRTTCRFMRRSIDCCCPHGYNFTGHPRAAIIQIGISGFNASLWPKFFARKDGQDGQYEEHCDLIGKGDGQEIIQYADNQGGKAKPHQEASPRNKLGHHKGEPKREPEPMR